MGAFCIWLPQSVGSLRSPFHRHKRVRISVFAKPTTSFGWRMGESAFYYRFYRRTAFFLIKTKPGRSGGAAINQPVFLGKLAEKDGMTAIDGQFGWEWKKVIISWLIFAVLFLAFNPNALMLILAGIFILLCSFFLLTLSSSLYGEEEKTVIELIEKHLLS